MRIVMTMLVAFLFCACDESVGYFPDYDGGTDSDTDSDQDSGIDTDCSDTDPCLDPPDTTTCVDEDTLGYYDQEINGTCIDGECSYTMQTKVCEYGCITAGDESKCYDPCEGFDCPIPDDECTGADTITMYAGGCVVEEETGEPYCSEVNEYYFFCSDFDLTTCVVVDDGDDYCA
jgi:hypothetical protein